MTTEGLVGRVTKVNQFSSQVDLISTHTEQENYLLIFITVLRIFLV